MTRPQSMASTTVLVTALTVASSASAALTMKEAIQRANEQNPALCAERLELQAARERRLQASLRPNPEFTVEAENFGGRNELKGFDGTEYTAQLGQTLELGGKRSKRIRAAEESVKLTAYDLAAKALDVRAETACRFADLLGAQEKLNLCRDSLVLAEAFLGAVSARVRSGKVSPMEEEKARILLADQKSALDGAERELQSARVRLSSMWGPTGPDFDTAQGDLPHIGSLPDLPALQARVKSNPDLARWDAERDHRKAVLSGEKAARWPDMTIGGGLRQFAETDSEAFVASVSFPLPLMNLNRGNIREATVLIEKVEQERLAAESEAGAALAEAYQTLCATLNRIRALGDEVIPRSKAVLESVQKGYTDGKFAYLDVLDARRTFFEARNTYVEALISGHRSWAAVERLVGSPLDNADEK